MAGQIENPRGGGFNRSTTLTAVLVVFCTVVVLVVVLPAVMVRTAPYREATRIDPNIVPPKTLWLADLHLKELMKKYPAAWISVELDNARNTVVDVNSSRTSDQLLIEAPMQYKARIEAVLAGYAIDDDEKVSDTSGGMDCVLSVSTHISFNGLEHLVPKVISSCGIKLHDRVDVSITRD